MEHPSTLRAMAFFSFFILLLASLLMSHVISCHSIGEQAEQSKDAAHYGSAKSGEAMDAFQSADEAQRSGKRITEKGMDAAKAMKDKSSDAYEKAKQKAHGAYQKVQSFASDASKGAGDLGKKAGDTMSNAKEKLTGSYGSDAANKGAVKDEREL